MNAPTHIGIEVFRDADAQNNTLDAALEGIAIVQAVTNALEITKTTRKLRIPHSPGQPFAPRLINWPQLKAPLSIMLSDRPLLRSDTRSGVYGVSLEPENIAFATTSAPHPSVTVAHELGHLLHAHYPGSADNHCSDASCIMYSHAQPDVITTERVKKKGVAGWMERNGYRPAQYIQRQEQGNAAFCTPCQEQLARRAFFMLKHLQGEEIPQSWR